MTEPIRFVGETRRRVRDMPGFRKTHRVPDRVDSATTRFLHELVAPELRADLDAVFAAVRTAFGWTRRQSKAAVEDGFAALRTPEFDYTVSASLDASDATMLLWRREVARLRSPALLDDQRFRAVFARVFHAIVVESPVDVEAWIDRVEALANPGLTLRYPADASWCELDMAGFGGLVRVEAGQFEVRTRGVLGKLDLFETYEAFRELLERGQRPMLE